MTCSCRSDSSIRAKTRRMASSGTTRASGIGWRGSGGARSWSRRPSAWWTSASPCSLASPETTGSPTSYLCWPNTLHKRGPAERASRRVIERTRSAYTSTLVEQEPDLHDDPELGDSVVLHHGLELLGPDGLDVADRAGRALDRFPDRILVALRGLA